MKKLMIPLALIVALASACGGGGTAKKDCVRTAMFNNVNSTSGLGFDDADRAKRDQYESVYLKALRNCGLTGSDIEIEIEAREIMGG